LHAKNLVKFHWPPLFDSSSSTAERLRQMQAQCHFAGKNGPLMKSPHVRAKKRVGAIEEVS
jgi:hypothetical protein